MKQKDKILHLRKYLSEFTGTFVLVFCGTGAIIVNQLSPGVITHPGISITFGLVVSVMIFALGDISGAHLNPAVTLAFTFFRKFPLGLLLPYLISQILGALLASVSLRMLFPENIMLGATLPAGSQMQSFVLECILTAILILVIFNVSTGEKEKGITAAIAIGSVVALEAMFAGPVSGASMNPARSLAPALVSGKTKGLWIYLTAPILGALIGAFLHQLLHQKKS
jgi:aquaporin Z